MNIVIAIIISTILFGFFAMYKAHKEDVLETASYLAWYNHPDQIWQRFKDGDV